MTEAPVTAASVEASVEAAAMTGLPASRIGQRSAARKLGMAAGGALVLLVVIAILAAVVAQSAIGRRAIADQIGRLTTNSGLHVTIGRIEGSILTRSTLDDVTVYDPHGAFLKAPVVQLDWRPLGWLTNRLDIRALTIRRATLLRAPETRPGDPNAPLLPDFDIRIDRLAIERLVVSKALLGEERHVDLHARVDIGKRHALVAVAGALGVGDRLAFLLNADRTHDRFQLGADIAAPRHGLIARLTGAPDDRRLRIGGRGTWHDWRGGLLADAGGKRVAVLRLTNRDGLFGLAGQVWAAGFVDPATARRLGEVFALTGQGQLADNVLNGRLGAASRSLHAGASGGLDLGDNAFRALAVTIRPAQTDAGRAILGPGTQLRGATLRLLGDGAFTAPSLATTLTADSFTSGPTTLQGIAAHGNARLDRSGWHLPLVVTTARILTGHAPVDPLLVGTHGTATLTLADGRLASDDIILTGRGADARLALRGTLATARYDITGRVNARGLRLDQLGAADATATIAMQLIGDGWRLGAQLAGRLDPTGSGAVAGFAGGPVRFAGTISTSDDRPIQIPHAVLTAPDATMTVGGVLRPDNTGSFTGSGRHVTYGPFTFDAQIAADGPHATIMLASPVPAAGIAGVKLAIAPVAGGLHITAGGNSMLGPFAGNLLLQTPANAPARLTIEHFDVWKTAVTGALTLGTGAVAGDLALAGGGIAGTIRLAPRGSGQGIAAHLTAIDARFGGARPLTIARANVDADGLIAHGHTTLTATGGAQGVGMGNLFIGRLAAKARLVDGRGQVTASLGGRRGSRFDLQTIADVAPNRIAVLANGSFAGQRILMPRRAVLTTEGAGWRLAPTEIDFGTGKVIGSGSIGGAETSIDLSLADMPLSLADVLASNVGLGGTASGTLTYTAPRAGAGGFPTGEARLMLKSLTRSGLSLTSRPIDVALVARLSAQALETRAVVTEGGQLRGRMQARVGGLPGNGTLPERIAAGTLAAQLRYSGPADALWRLLGIDTFDLTGPLALAADVAGTTQDPRIDGTLTSDNLRLQSALTGTDITGVRARGLFDGSRLVLSELSGRTAGNGEVVGSGSVDFSGIKPGHEAAIDLRLGARRAQILNRPDIAATVTGPIRIASDGASGTIAGRLAIDTARWRFGQASAAADLPHIPTREINRGADIAPPNPNAIPWRYMIDAAGSARIFVQGQGIDSEWNARLKLRGSLDDPAITGEAGLVEGTYAFAGKRFNLTRGRVSFDGSTPVDPRVDIAATADVTGLTATVTVTGSGLNPQITFTSVPPLPEEELLSRLLFGDSITTISAPEALQLGAAVASLHGGGGLDPINKLRGAIGLDRLRIVSADTTIGRQTGVAAGKYLGRHIYAELISDGRGYSATNLEFRVTSWLSLLATVSTVGRQSVNAKVSHDY